MYRTAILEFLAREHHNFLDVKEKRMIITLFGKKPIDEFGPLLNFDYFFIYDVCLPRIFKKYSPLKDEEINYLQKINQITYTSRENFLKLSDNFSLKGYLNQEEFQTIYLIPIVSKEKTVGLIFLLTDALEPIDLTCYKASLTTLYQDLIHEEYLELNENIKDLAPTNEYLFLSQGGYFVSNEAKNKLNLEKNFFQANNQGIEKIIEKYHLEHKSFNYFCNKYTVYYGFDKDCNEPISAILNINSLGSYLPEKDYSLIILETNNLKKLQKIFQVEELRDFIVFSTNDFYVILINGSFSKVLFKHLFDCFSYYLLLRSKELPKGIDINKTLDYILKNKPLDFSFEDYQASLITKSNVNQVIDTQSLVKPFISSKGDVLYPINSYIKNYQDMFDQDTFDERIKKGLNRILKNGDVKILCYGPFEGLSNKKLINYSKKNQLFYVLNLSSVKNVTKDNLLSKILTTKSNDFVLLADSSVYLDFNHYDLLQYLDGIYLSDNEYQMLKTNNSVFNLIMNYFVSLNKIIIIDTPINFTNNSQIYSKGEE